jgi:hypothetical protein
MTPLSTILRGASVACLILTAGLLGAWGRASGLPLPPSARAAAVATESGRVILARAKEDMGENGLAVNAYLWRAALDTLSFMPLADAQPAGGVIITEWYAVPSAPDERFKMTVYITDKRLRSDGVRVAVFRQVRSKSQVWQDATVDPETSTKLENAILARARQYKLSLGK